MSETKNKDLPIEEFSFLNQGKSSLITFILIALFIDIFFISVSSDIIIFSILVFYIISIWFFKIKSKLTFFICLVLLSSMFLFYLVSGPSQRAEKSAVWLFFFLAIGIFQQWRE